MLYAFLLSFVLGPWNIAFNEQTSDLALTFTGDGAPTVQMDGTLAFQRETDALQFVLPRDNGPRRLMAVDSKGEICGYLSFQQDGSRLEFCLHTWNPVLAKLTGEFSWTTTFKAEPRAFVCRVQPTPGDRVISMATPGGDSLRNNAVFLPETDTLIEFFGENVRVENIERFNALRDLIGVRGRELRPVLEIRFVAVVFLRVVRRGDVDTRDASEFSYRKG